MSDLVACMGCGAEIAKAAAQRDSSGRTVCTACQSKDLSDLSDALAFGEQMDLGRELEAQRARKLVRLAVGAVVLLVLIGGLLSAR